MIQITQQELITLLSGLRGATPVTIVAVTEPKMNKTGNPYIGRVLKTQSSNVFVNFNYENAVNNARFKESGETGFTAHPRKWGVRIAGTPLVLNKGIYYLECRFFKASDPTYTIDNVVVDKSVLEPFMPATYSNAEHQGLSAEKEVIIRDFKLTNIKEIVVNRNYYEVI